MSVFFEKEEDWKDFLASDAQQQLAELFENTKKHKGAYLQSGDVKIAQLWCALVEMKKEIEELKSAIEKVSAPFRAIAVVGDMEKKKAIQKLVSEIIRPTEEETTEATKRLVESLMKF